MSDGIKLSAKYPGVIYTPREIAVIYDLSGCIWVDHARSSDCKFCNERHLATECKHVEVKGSAVRRIK